MTDRQHLDVEAIRGTLDGVLNRAKSDPGYLAQLKSDTIGTLQAAGIPHGAAGEISEQMGFESEVAGYVRCAMTDNCAYTCDRITCIVTMCGNIPYSN